MLQYSEYNAKGSSHIMTLWISCDEVGGRHTTTPKGEKFWDDTWRSSTYEAGRLSGKAAS
jgi:hypothetical protein